MENQDPPEYLLDIVAKQDLEATTNPIVQCSYHKYATTCQKYYKFEKLFFIKTKCDLYWFQKLVKFSKCSGFQLKTFKDPDTNDTFLGFYFIPKLYDVQEMTESLVGLLMQHYFSKVEPCIQEPTYSYRAKTQFFQDSRTSQPQQLNLRTANSFDVTITEFYEKMKQYHESDNLQSEIDVQHPKLRAILRPYQKNGIKWMLQREQKTLYLPTEFIKISSKRDPEKTFFFNERTWELYDLELDTSFAMPSGGILADEMGLGKTVEILGLILCNPYRHKRKHSEIEEDCSEPMEAEFLLEDSKLKCICTKALTDDKETIICESCGNSQHKNCVLKNAVAKGKKYMCPVCWKNCNTKVESRTTIICSPGTIKNQWVEEINKHVRDPDFKVLVYNGVAGTGWISPYDLAEYDIIVTDYNVLSNEIYYTKSMIRNMRNEKKYHNPISPLPFVKFWRVCLDEAQMVENASNQVSKMVKTLSAHHRWAVTGTPVEKDISSLSGLLDFLDLYPYYDPRIWRELRDNFCTGKNDQIIEVMGKVFWRTCKKDVIDEIGIPPQTEVLHSVTMSDLQTIFYNTAHMQAETDFRKYASRIGYDVNDTMSHMNSTTINALLEHMRKLRQDCTIPSLFHRNAETSVVKQALTPKELQHHLVSNNEIECKSQLRTVASSLNGIAAIHIAKNGFEKAISCYKSVLRWSKDYTGTVHVDALLKIHALHNLMDIIEITGNEEELKHKQEYLEECNKLEWKFINNFYEKVQQIQIGLDGQTEALEEAEIKLQDFKGDWWRNFLCALEKNSLEYSLIDKIRNEMFSINVNAEIPDEIRSCHGINLFLTFWWDKVQNLYEEVQKQFQDLEYFSKNLKPMHLMTPEEQQKIQTLVAEAFECHLNLEEDEDGNQIRGENLCDLCILKDQLNQYECSIFNKILVDNEAEGTWNPRLEENILKSVLNFAKKTNSGKPFVKTGNAFFKYLEVLKNQFKEYSQLWVEVNYTVSGYDEINMCKTRLQVVEPEEINENDTKFSSKISKYEINDQMATFEMQKIEAEREFFKIQGRIKYLQYLKDKNEPQECPVCNQTPSDRYCVLNCGHNLCLMCMTQILKFNRHRFTCPVCRAEESSANIYTVTCSKSLDGVVLKGSYSSKIDEIVKTVLQLRKEENDVKILVFSHWDNILMMIGRALDDNTIEYRFNKGKFEKNLKEFKDFSYNVTCLLMNLRSGSKGLNLTEATHVFLVEPILNPADELQAVGRVHRIGQTRPTFVHRFIVENTIEETIHHEIMKDYNKWKAKDVSINDLESLFLVKGEKIQSGGILNM